MPVPPEPPRDKPNTYFVEDRSNQEEMSRLHLQDKLLTASMGGVLPEQPDPTRFQRVLDVGCGTGGWLIELAKTLPDSRLLVGIDASHTYIEYASQQAKEAGVSDRVEFHAADALLMLEFPDSFFDLVNHRLAISWLRTWEWPKLLQEYRRVCKPKGVVRVNEYVNMGTSNSPAFTRLVELGLAAFYQSGHTFTPTGEGLSSELVRLFEQQGLHEVQTLTHALGTRAGGPKWQGAFQLNKMAFRTTSAFTRKWMRPPEDYEEIYQQMLREMQQPDFEITASLVTVWGAPSPSPLQARENQQGGIPRE